MTAAKIIKSKEIIFLILLSFYFNIYHSFIHSSHISGSSYHGIPLKKKSFSTIQTSQRITTKISAESNTPLSVPEIYPTVAHIEKYPRLPVWPAWNGVILFLLSKLTFISPKTVANLEFKIGGRVCPQSLFTPQNSPFLLLVHHTHTFSFGDLFRYLQRLLILPEGFPAHAHRGFITLTYILEGGFTHRDSLGVKQKYGSSDDNNRMHSQWMVAGAGMLHEEMWDVPFWGNNGIFGNGKQELYQLWINLPKEFKLVSPSCTLLGESDGSAPVVQLNDSKTIVLCGEFKEKKGAITPYSPIDIFHVQISKNGQWTHSIPLNHDTNMLYIRKGSLIIDDQVVLPHNTVFLNQVDSIQISAAEGEETDFLWLSGEKLNEPIAAQGSMVMNTEMEIQKAYEDYSLGKMGLPWNHKLTDEEWLEHVQKFPSQYR